MPHWDPVSQGKIRDLLSSLSAMSGETAERKMGANAAYPQDACSVNNLTAKPNADGSVTIRFGGDPGQSIYLAIMPGWNYLVRLYRPRREAIDGTWAFPGAEPARG